ncbi:ParA family protein [Gilliamella sp. Pas-s25]|uniref:ParA family protein n=1 Tax=Gilliamella sp. Pas-s25 TaxID=2687310 RepID=UPI00135EF525|nr:ParA family protein [Gilliamella sp. Pas-s25]MWP62989.1 AAA family ATPase [Gilliamella sp. Pas-s25]
MIIVVGCNKGGAGKTTTAINLTVALALKNKDVCLVDADPQRSASKWQLLRENENIQPAINLVEKRENIASVTTPLK